MKIIQKIQNSPLIKNSIIYVISDGVNKGMNFFILPFLTYYISPEGMGLVTNFNVLVQILTLLGGVTMINILPFIFYKRTKEEIQGYVSNLVFIITGLIILLLALVCCFKTILYNQLQLNVDFQIGSLIYVLAAQIIQLRLILWRLEDAPISFARLSILQTVLNLTFVVILVIWAQMEYQGRIQGMILSNILIAVYCIYDLHKNDYLKLNYNKLYIKEALLFGLPLVPHALSFWLKSGVDKILITKYIGLEENGIYSIAVTIGGLLMMFVTAFSNAYTPHLQKRIDTMERGKEYETKSDIVKQAYQIALAFTILCILAIFIGKFCILFFIDKRYIGATNYIPWIFIGILFQVFYLLVVHYIYIGKKTFILGIITFSISVLQVFMSYFFINRFGTIGAAYTFAIGSFLIFLAIAIYSNKVYPMPWFNFYKKQYDKF